MNKDSFSFINTSFLIFIVSCIFLCSCTYTVASYPLIAVDKIERQHLQPCYVAPQKVQFTSHYKHVYLFPFFYTIDLDINIVENSISETVEAVPGAIGLYDCKVVETPRFFFPFVLGVNDVKVEGYPLMQGSMPSRR